VNLKKLGGIITKTITLYPREGNSPPRIVETASGMLNAIGLQNEGINKFLEEKMPFLRKIGVPIVVSIGGDKVQEYVKLAKILDKTKGVVALELNISCPNIKSKQYLVAQDRDATYQLVKQVRDATSKAVIIKLSPNVTDIVSIAQAAKEAGSDAVSLVNTFLGMSIDIQTKAPKLGNITGGLSGPAIKPIALRMVWQVAKSVDIPVIGMGGIMNADDAVEFIIAGASAICVGTANLVDPSVSTKIIKGIEDYLNRNKIKDINKLIGCIKNDQ
ncbi:MAG: dihydroorotate dehydrogenase, partial [Candidatus Omnitrophica bacterium]|nr:dihydroorotate dehydrogenase [Candidatus Omnitrophota bacterium]